MHNIWRRYNHILISNQPPDKVIDTRDVFYEIITTNSILARWVSSFDCKKEMPFWYVIKDNNPLIESYSRNTRNQIKKGLKSFIIKKVIKGDIKKEAYSIYRCTFESYDNNETILSSKDFYANFNDKFDYWGVYKSNKLVGYAQNRVYEKSCDYSTIKINPKHKIRMFHILRIDDTIKKDKGNNLADDLLANEELIL